MNVPGVLEQIPNSHKNVVIHCDDDLKFKCFSYKDLKESILIISQKLRLLNVEKSAILVVLPTNSYLLPPIILGIIDTSSPFFCTSPRNSDDLINLLQRHQINFFISQYHPETLLGKEKCLNYQKITVFGAESLFICQFRERKQEIASIGEDIVYWMETSGSTGTPKIVKVPWGCILPNISSLSEKLKLSSNDVIYSTSPATFDPFMVDLLLTIANSATILLTTDRLRIAPSREFAEKLFLQSNGGEVTFLQMTPTLFLNFGQKILQEVVLSGDSSLRICLLGGEAFPKKNLIRCSNNRIRFFNIYGITEISCWSHLREVNLADEENVDIGEALDESIEVEIREGGELWIGSTSRKCLLEDENEEILRKGEIIYRNTGDIVEERNGKIFFSARSNKIIKRFGKQVNLAKIEEQAKDIETIERVQCVFVQESKRIVLFFKSEQEVNLMEKLNETLTSAEVPDEVVKIEEFPQSTHGKISEEKLLKFYLKIDAERGKKNLLIEDDFLNSIQQILQSNISLFKSFINLGGDSMKALRLVSEMGKRSKREFPELLLMLLNPSISLQDIVKYLRSSIHQSTDIKTSRDIPTSSSSLQLNFQWRVNLGKCVDATPSIFLGEPPKVAVGSHSHKLISVNPKSGDILYEEMLEDRIESRVAFCPEGFGFVGCYRGFLYKFSIDDKKIIWKFDSTAMIKCLPLILDDLVVFGNYGQEKNVWCISRTTGNLIWSTKIGDKGILANPLQINGDIILLATLNGSVAILHAKDGKELSQKVLKSPIFSSPALIKFSNVLEVKILIAEVSGTVNIFTVRENHILEQGNPFKVSGNVFSGFTIFNLKADSALVAFGCHNSCIYCLRVNSREAFLSLEWKTRLNSPIYSTPCSISEEFLCCCTTSGQLTVLCGKVGRIECCVQLPGEAFSSPIAQDGQIFIGCRDNHLYCYSL